MPDALALDVAEDGKGSPSRRRHDHSNPDRRRPSRCPQRITRHARLTIGL
jgi:hypothetical protein